jgi:tetratricopeptide (TPR) repeat protein
MHSVNEQIKLAKYWLQSGDIKSAKALLLELVKLQPQQAEAHELLALIYANEGDFGQALFLLQELGKNPNCSFSSLLHLGDLYLQLGQAQAAVPAYQASLKRAGAFFEGFHNLGLAHSQLFQFEEASRAFRQACALNPSSYEAHLNLGAALKNIGEYEQSLVHINQAQALNPTDAGVWLNKGVTFEAMNAQEKALECYEVALQLNPNYLEAYSNKANSLAVLGRHADAQMAFESALSMNPQDPDTLYNLSYLQLAQGNFEQGWPNYENRWLRQNAPPLLFSNLSRLVTLDGIAGKHILAWSEQGLGDAIQFCRYIPALHKLGAKITLATHAPLIELLDGLEGVDQIIAIDENAPNDCHAQIPLMSLPLLFQRAGQTIPPKPPYLKTDPIKRTSWHERLKGDKRLKVGLVWSGGFRPNQPECWGVNGRRNIPLEIIAQLQEIKGVQFFSLQKGDPAEAELQEKKDLIWPSNNLSIYTSELHTFADTAALIENLDLVISVDTSTAHVAGALGKPLWILNRFDSCWRWQIQREETGWYPEAKLFNQTAPGDWDTVIHKVQSELTQLVNQAQ